MTKSLMSQAVTTIALRDYAVASDGEVWTVTALPGVLAVDIIAESKALAYGDLVHYLCEHRRKDVQDLITELKAIQ